MAGKHALLIGVDKYCNLDKKYELGGCVSDAQLMKNILCTYYGFEEQNITELHDAQATRDNILAAMNALVEKVDKDDIVAFHFSGHGSRRTARDQTKGTGKDSTIMPHDSGRNPLPNLDINNDEIQAWLQRLTKNTSNVSLTFDCCHSGTVTRDAFAAAVRGVPDDERSLEEMGIDPASLPDIEKPATRGVDSGGWMALGERYVVMSGCRDNEVSHEYSREEGGQKSRNGALTYFLSNALVKAKPGSTYRDIFELAHRGVNSKYPNQNPQLEGAKDRELFGTRDIEPLRFVPVSEIDGNTVTLDGGSAHGIIAGSTWSILPAGAKKKTGADVLGTLEVNTVGALTSEAILKDSHGDIAAGSRCIEKAPSPDQFLLSVDLGQVSGEAAGELAAAIDDSKLLSRAANADAADIRAYILEPRQQSADPVPQLEQISSTSWALLNEAGDLAMPLRPVDEAGAIKILTENLETLSRYRNALQLDNPDEDLDVEFNIYRETGPDEWEKINGGEWCFEEGDCIAFECINKEDTPVFVSVLDFGLSGKIQLLFPPRTTSELIGPGNTLKIGTGKRRIRLGLPKNFSSDEGSGAFKAFITTDEADFQWLQQDGTRSAGSGKSGLRKQFEAAYNGPKTREASMDEEEDASEKWIATARSFNIKRNALKG
jgi:hypothetical protein